MSPIQGPTWENLSSGPDGAAVSIQFDEFELPVVAPLLPPVCAINEMQVGAKVYEVMTHWGPPSKITHGTTL